MANSNGFAGFANDQVVRFTGTATDIQTLASFAPADTDDPLEDKARNRCVQVSNFERGAGLDYLTNPLKSWVSRRWSQTSSPDPDQDVEMTIETSDAMISFDSASFTYVRSWHNSNPRQRGPETWVLDSILNGTTREMHKVTLSSGAVELDIDRVDLSSIPTIHPGERCLFRWAGALSGESGWGGFKGGGETIIITGSVRKPLVLFDPISTTSDLEAEHADPNVLTSPLTRGPGNSASTGLADAWVSGSWGGGGRSANDYFETTLTALAPIQFDCMAFTLARSTGFNASDGPTRLGLEYILNDTPAVELFFVTTTFGADIASFPVDKLDLSQIPRLDYGDSITFRWFGFQGGASGLYGLSGARKLAFYGQTGIPLGLESIAVDNGQAVLQVRSEPGARLRVEGSENGESWSEDTSFTSNRIIQERSLQATDPVRLFRVAPNP